jgi:uncharacterized protein (DUF433 family)
MGCVSNELAQAPTRLRKSGKSNRAKQLLTVKSSDFEVFGEEIRNDLDPKGPLERLVADYLIEAAWRLKHAIERKHAIESESSKTEAAPARIRPTAVETAARSLREAFEAFEACRKIKGPAIPSAFLGGVGRAPEVEPNEWPIVPTNDGETAVDDEISHWRDRLTFDFEVSDVSPVVKGTWVTVGHVVSLIVDGWTWADILRAHPELSEDDIRACVTYAMDEENASR